LEGLDGKSWHLFKEDVRADRLQQIDPLARNQRHEISETVIKEVLGQDRGNDKVEG
jgi:hypothetical protein